MNRQRALTTLLFISTILLMEGLARVYSAYTLRPDTSHPKTQPSAETRSFDHQLGWVTKPNFSAKIKGWNATVNTLPEGIRSNGKSPLRSTSRPILAVGDSFTFGDKVEDQQTWPAFLESQLALRAINAGVSGYGLDQSVLRARQLVDSIKPSLVILSLIDDDIERMSYSIFLGRSKPYVSYEHGIVKYHTDHLIDPISNLNSPRMHRFALYRLGEKLFQQVFNPRMATLSPNFRSEDQPLIACKLLQGLGSELSQRQIKFITLIQYASDLENTHRSLKQCLDQEELEVIDTYDALSALKHADPIAFAQLYSGHMTAQGNEFVAKIVSEHLKSRIQSLWHKP